MSDTYMSELRLSQNILMHNPNVLGSPKNVGAAEFTVSSSGKALPVPAIRKLSGLCVMASINPEGLFRKLRNALALRRLPRPLQFLFAVLE